MSTETRHHQTMSAWAVALVALAAGALGSLAHAAPSVYLSPSAGTIGSGDSVAIDVFVEDVVDLRLYEVVVDVVAAGEGALELTDLIIDEQRTDFVFAGVSSLLCASDPNQLRMSCSPLSADCIDVPAGSPAYLGTYVFTAGAGTSTSFEINVSLAQTLLIDCAAELIPGVLGGNATIEVDVPVPDLWLSPALTTLERGESVTIDVYIENAARLRLYEVVLDVASAPGTSLELTDLVIDDQRADFVFKGAGSLASVTDPARRRITCTPLAEHCVDIEQGSPAYLGSYTFKANSSTIATFSVSVADQPDSFIVDCDGYTIHPFTSSGATVEVEVPDPTIFVMPAAADVSTGRTVDLDVYIQSVDDLRLYEIGLVVTGGSGGALDLENLYVDESRGDFIFADAADVTVTTDPATGRLICTPLSSDLCVDVTTNQPAYLGTYTYRANAGVGEVFAVQVAEGPVSRLINCALDSISPFGRPASSVTTVELQNRAPVAVCGGPYTCFVGTSTQPPCPLDGCGSYDPDEELGDSITAYEWELDGVEPYDFDEAAGCEAEYVWSAPGTYAVGLRVTDDPASGLAGAPLTDICWTTVEVKLDSGLPQTQYSIQPEVPDGLNGWYRTSPSVTLSATDPPAAGEDASGVCEVRYSIDDQNQGTFPGGVLQILLEDGDHELSVYAIDCAGNIGPTSTSPIRVDTAAPNTQIVSGPAEGAVINQTSVEFCFSGQDAVVSSDQLEYAWCLGAGCDPSAEPFTAATCQTFDSLSEGSHTLRVVARDPAGNIDSSPATRVFTVDLTSPFVLQHRPTGALNEPVDQIDVTFNSPIDPASFTADDITLLDSAQQPITIDSLQSLGGNTWRIRFAEQSSEGEYCIEIGPEITDLAGNLLDQDGDGNPGEPVDDVYTGCLTIDTTSPRIGSHDPVGSVGTAVDHLDLNFDEAVLADGCSAASFRLLDPRGQQVSVTGPQQISDQQWQVTFPAANVAGEYCLTVTPCFTDLAGNVLDQDGDGTGGEFQEDDYLACFTRVLPDLVVADADGPQTVILGDAFEVSWRVSNTGLGVASSSWSDRIYLSADPNLTPEDDRLLAAVQRPNPLDPNAQYSAMQSVQIPIEPGFEDGTHWLYVITDWANSEPESDETNNYSAAVPIEFEYPALPDLVVENFDAPSTIVAGDSFDVSWELVNIGPLPASAAWVDRLYLSADDTLDASDTLLSLSPGPGILDPNNRIPVLLTLDGITESGEYWLIVKVDANNDVAEGIGESNNTYVHAVPLDVTPQPRPDLTVLTASSDPDAVAGGVLSVSWTVENHGSTVLNSAWHDRVYLSQDSVLGSDTLLGSFQVAESLEIGESYTRNEVVTVPFDLEGPYYLIVVTDAANAVLEGSGEDDNDYVTTSTVLVTRPPLPDLVASTFIAPEAATILSRIPLTWAVTNEGELPASGPWSDYLYLSTDARFDASDVRIGQFQYTDTLDPNERYELTNEVILPAQTGTFWLILVTNGDSLLQEGGALANNVRVSDAPIQIDLPDRADLVVQQVDVPNPVGAGELTSLTWTVGNIGPVAATGTWVTRVLASSDQMIGNDTILATFVYEDQTLDPNTSALRTELIPLPNMPQGFHILVCVDVGDAIWEESEENNCGATQLPATILLPDLQVMEVTAPPAALADGLASISWTVENIGSATARGAWIDTVYLSMDEFIDPDDFVVGTYARAIPVDSNRTYTVLRDVPVPGRANGSYRFLVHADSAGQLFEESDQNNIGQTLGLTEVTQPPRPNLVVTQLTQPTDGTIGSELPITWQVTNIGQATARGPWSERVLAVPTDPNLPAVELATIGLNVDLDPNQSTLISRMVNYPAPGGEYRLSVTTDRADNVNEGLGADELDNTLASDPFLSQDYLVELFVEGEDFHAGETIEITGQAFELDGVTPLANVPVQVDVSVRGTRRTINDPAALMTDLDGNFSVMFRPLSGEAGVYTLRAGPPGAVWDDVAESFRIWGMRSEPSNGVVNATSGSATTGTIWIRNLGDLPINNLQAVVEGAPVELDVQVDLASSTIAPLGRVRATFSVTPDLAYSGSGDAVMLNFTSDEAAAVTTQLSVNTFPAQPYLITTPSFLDGEMVRGKQTLIELQIRNFGAVPAEDLHVYLPDGVPWMQLITTRIPSLESGDSATLVLQLLPDTTLPLGHQSGSITIRNPENTYGVNVPYSFDVTSDQLTSIRVEVKDEATFWSTQDYQPEGGPLVPDATVQLLDPDSESVIAERKSDPLAVETAPIEFFNVTEGYYTLRVVAPDHAPYSETILVEAGTDNEFEPFIPAESVEYTWTVRETEIEDISLITLTVLFETNVPRPVVTVDPPVLDLEQIDVDETQVDFTITNHGLIAAEEVKLNFGSHPNWEITPLVDEIGTLLPGENQAVVVPVTIRKLPGVALAGEQCHIEAGVVWSLICIGRQYFSVPILVLHAVGDCGDPTPGGGGVWGGGGPSGGPGAPFTIQPSHSPPVECEECDPNSYKGKELLCKDVSYLFKPAEAAIDAYITAQTTGWIKPTTKITAKGCLKTCCDENGGLGLEGVIEAKGELKLALIDANPKFDVGGSYTIPAQPVDITLTGSGTAQAILDLSTTPWVSATAETGCNLGEPRVEACAGINADAQAAAEVKASAGVSGGPIEFVNAEFHALGNVYGGATAQVCWSSDNGLEGQACFKGVYYEYAIEFTAEDVLGGEHSWKPVPCERVYIFNPAGTEGCPPPSDCGDVIYAAEQSGLMIDEDVFLPMSAEELEDEFTRSLPRHVYNYVSKPMHASQVAAATDEPQIEAADEGTCARVWLQLQQEVAITRTAFEGILEVFNPPSLAPVEDFYADIDIYDPNGELVTDRFFILPPDLINIDDIDGAGFIAPGITSRIHWLIVPTKEAAPMQDTEYLVGGLFTYTQDGVTQVVELAPANITVRPDPSLSLRYFWQRDVFADDPFTPEIEPSEPFSLGLIMDNQGYGEARNVRITSSQPQIIENARSLLINFELIGTQIDDQEIMPSLTVNLGDIAPFTRRVVRWLMTSTLQGQFIDYIATYENLTGLGDPRVSLIDSVDIFELIHVVRVVDPNDDQIMDFLTNELSGQDDPLEDPNVPDLIDLPDRVHTSDGRIEAVSTLLDLVPTPIPDEYRLTVDVPAQSGWVYMKFPDPFEGSYEIAEVIRESDGRRLVTEYNAWLTDRTFREGGQQPERTHRIHLFDYEPAGVYTIYFSPAAVPPQAPNFAEITASTVQIANLGTLNTAGTEHAVVEANSGLFVGPTGALQSTPYWLARDTWVGRRIRGLLAETEYRFKSQARLNSVESAFGQSSRVTTGLAGDIDGSGIVDETDLGILRAVLGKSFDDEGFDPRADLDGDGRITYRDLGILRRNMLVPESNQPRQIKDVELEEATDRMSGRPLDGRLSGSLRRP
jgi:subtilase family serine protease/uncharacterized membrane protein